MARKVALRVAAASTAVVLCLIAAWGGGVASSQGSPGPTLHGQTPMNTFKGPDQTPKGPNLHGQTLKVIAVGPDFDTVIVFHTEQILQQWGAKVSQIVVDTPTLAYAGLTTGQGDITGVSPLGGLDAVQGGLPVKTFAIDGPRTDDVFVSKASITSMRQMKGATVGVLDLNSLNGIEVGLALGTGGLTTSDVNIVQAGGQDVRVEALAAGRLDAGPISLQAYQTVLKPLGFHILFNYTTQAPGLIFDTLWATTSWLSKHTALAVAIAQAQLDSFRWFDDPKDKGAFIKLATSQLTGDTAAQASEVYDAYIAYKFYPEKAIFTKPLVTKNQQLFLKYNLISKPTPIDQWVAFGIETKALAAYNADANNTG